MPRMPKWPISDRKNQWGYFGILNISIHVSYFCSSHFEPFWRPHVHFFYAGLRQCSWHMLETILVFSHQHQFSQKPWPESQTVKCIWKWFCELPREIQNHLWNAILICVEKIVAWQSHQTKYPEPKLIAGWLLLTSSRVFPHNLNSLCIPFNFWTKRSGRLWAFG